METTQAWRDRIVGFRRLPVDQLEPHPDNPRIHGDTQRTAMIGVLREIGVADALLVRKLAPKRYQVIDGHLRRDISPGQKLPCLILDVDEAEAAKIIATHDTLAGMATIDGPTFDRLVESVSFDDPEVAKMIEATAEDADRAMDAVVEDAGPQTDRAGELREKWGTEPGQLWIVEGKQTHRLLCGDATKKADVERVMGGEMAVLIHADPPYGMGKESEGVANDNLYRERLDAFQMAWWTTCRPFCEDNGSAYIWGVAEDLWRLWYRGLKDSERLTLRNEIVWNKHDGQGMGTESCRMYPVASERCLFFMLGEQGFNNNADNYWEGWDSIVNYLREEKEKTGWDIATFKRLAGHSETSGCHWFDKSQWMFPTKDVYESWQSAAKGHDAFKREHDELKREHDELKREHDELKREFYATRACFDNTHENMTDVWDFGRVTGEDRHGHPTPKPVETIGRILKTSSPSNSIVYDPFLGSGTTMVAAEQLGRRCFGIEIDPGYVAVTLERMTQAGLSCRIEEE